MPIFLKKFLHKFFLFFWRSWYRESDNIELQEIHLKHCALIPNRDLLLQNLPKQSVGAELGVEYGTFSEKIMEIVNPSELHLVDLWKNKSVFQKCKATMTHAKVQMHQMDSLHFLHSRQTNSLDWVYIDTDHGYKVTKSELEESARVVKDNGLICGHDYVQISSGLRRYGVVQAVNEFCIKHSYEFAFLTNESNRHLSFALRKMP